MAPSEPFGSPANLSANVFARDPFAALVGLTSGLNSLAILLRVRLVVEGSQQGRAEGWISDGERAQEAMCFYELCVGEGVHQSVKTGARRGRGIRRHHHLLA